MSQISLLVAFLIIFTYSADFYSDGRPRSTNCGTCNLHLDREKRDVADAALGTLMGQSVEAAKALWNSANGESRAKLAIRLTNYSKWRLCKPIYKEVRNCFTHTDVVSTQQLKIYM